MSNFSITAEALLRAMVIIDKPQGKGCDCLIEYAGEGVARIAADEPYAMRHHGVHVRVEVPVQGEGQPFAVALNHATLKKLATLCKGMDVRFDHDEARAENERVVVEFGDSGEFKLPLRASEHGLWDYIYNHEPLDFVDVKTSEFVSAVSRVFPFRRQKNDKYNGNSFKGVWFQADDFCGLNVLATDGYAVAQLRFYDNIVHVAGDEDESPLVKNRGTGFAHMDKFAATLLAAKCERVRINFCANFLMATADSDIGRVCVVNASHRDEKFPKWQQLIPQGLPRWFQLSADDAIAARDFLDTLKNAKMNVNFGPDGIEGATPGTLPGEGQIKFRKLAIDNGRGDVSGQFNPEYVAKALKFFGEDEVHVYAVAKGKPIFVRGGHKPGMVIVAPIYIPAPKPETEPAATAEAV